MLHREHAWGGAGQDVDPCLVEVWPRSWGKPAVGDGGDDQDNEEPGPAARTTRGSGLMADATGFFVQSPHPGGEPGRWPAAGA